MHVQFSKKKNKTENYDDDKKQKETDEIEQCHVYITGEMSHHDLLAATQAGVAVILTGHSNCERGYLTPMAKIIQSRFREEYDESPTESTSSTNSISEVMISTVDADPLTIL